MASHYSQHGTNVKTERQALISEAIIHSSVHDVMLR